RGPPAPHIRARHFVVCAQNHDQSGNRAKGERLTDLTDEGGRRAAAAVIALQPALPFYFQGEEWGAREPFQYFVSHTDAALVEAVREGRRGEVKGVAREGGPAPVPGQAVRRGQNDRARQRARARGGAKAV